MGDEKGSQAFLRMSVKFWVPVKHLASVKTEILNHLPQYWYKNIRDPFIASIYLDNDELSMYRSRMNLREGSQIVRIRVYGSRKKHKVVFVERKTHLKGWRGLDSLKERFTLESSRLGDLTQGLLVEDENSPNAMLVQEIQDAVTQLQLKPSIRTTYHRCAYQNGEDLSLRISLDENLTFIKDRSNLSEPDSIDWSEEYANNLPPSDVHRFQYAVLEVKIQKSENNPSDGMPAWITELEHKGHIIEVAKFSKFLTATALHNFAQVDEIPSWFKLFGVADTPDVATSSSKKDAHILLEAGEELKRDVSPTGGKPSSGRSSQPLRMSGELYQGKQLVHRNMRIGPKLFLSNERTFLNWAQQILAVSTFGGVLIQQDDYDTPVLISGVLVVILAVIVLMRVLFKYRERVKVVKEMREPVHAFAESIAPVSYSILVLSIMLGVLITGIVG
jgi:uncharacterized membrane protein YidH (DUF202 family)